ncbi:hypothetical protein LCGC14_2999660, partial [marine sediment metagenome]
TEVVDRARGAGQVVDEVDRPLDLDAFSQVLVHELEVGGADVLDVLERPRVQVVDADHPLPALQQVLAQVRAHESRAAADNTGSHAGSNCNSGVCLS